MSQEQEEMRALTLRLNQAVTAKRLTPESREDINRDKKTQEEIVKANGIPASEMAMNPFLVAFLLDNTYSMYTGIDPRSGRQVEFDKDDPRSNVAALRTGFNTIKDALSTDPMPERFYVAAFTMAGRDTVLQPWRPLRETITLNAANFVADGGTTPLYRRTGQALASLIDKEHQARVARKGKPQGALIVITDGGNNEHDEDQPRATAGLVSVTKAVRENVVTMLGLKSGSVDFTREAAKMNIDDILPIDSNPATILRVLGKYGDFLRLAAVPGNILQITEPGEGFRKYIEEQQRQGQ